MLARQFPRTFNAVSCARSFTVATNQKLSHNKHTTLQRFNNQQQTQLQQIRSASSIPNVNFDNVAAADAAKQIIDKVACMWITNNVN